MTASRSRAVCSRSWPGSGSKVPCQPGTPREWPGPPRSDRTYPHVEAFYSLVGVKQGDKMWLAPEQRVKIW